MARGFRLVTTATRARVEKRTFGWVPDTVACIQVPVRTVIASRGT